VYWLGSVWWHPLAGLGVLLLAVTLYGVLLARLPLHAKNGVRQLKTLRHSA
jgi:hypothetical protein